MCYKLTFILFEEVRVVPACGFIARFLSGILTDEFMVCLFGMLAVNNTRVCYISIVEKSI